MKTVIKAIFLVLLISQYSIAEQTQRMKNKMEQSSEKSGSNGGQIISGILLAGSLLALAANKSSEPEGKDHKNNGLFIGLAVASGIGLYMSSKKDKEIRLTVSESNEPIFAFQYHF